MKSFRIYHALFAIGAVVAYFTAEELGLVHAWAGYAIAALVALRLLLGLVQAKGFEFRRLLPRFGVAPRGQGGLRHPAIGHALALLLLTGIAGTAGTGIAMDGGGTLVGQSIRADDDGERHDEHRRHGHENEDEDDDGDFSLNLIPQAQAETGENERDDHEGPLGEVHETLGNLLLPLALLHAAWLLLFRFDLARFILFAPRRNART